MLEGELMDYCSRRGTVAERVCNDPKSFQPSVESVTLPDPIGKQRKPWYDANNRPLDVDDMLYCSRTVNGY